MIFQKLNNTPATDPVVADDNNQAEEQLEQVLNQQMSADEQELAKVLADIDSQVSAMDGSESIEPIATDVVTDEANSQSVADQLMTDDGIVSTGNEATIVANADLINDMAIELDSIEEVQTEVESGSAVTEPAANSIAETPVALSDVQQRAIEDLRPLVDKIQLEDQEKYEVILLLIRSTNDQSLLDPLYKAAREIKDEARRAQALLDVIKEADYFKHKA